MRAHFSEVLARESDCLARVTDEAKLACWRRRIVDELMTLGSPYALALRPTGDVRDRAAFLDRWRDLIAAAVNRLPQSRAPKAPNGFSTQSERPGVDGQEAAILILAALHGGSTLSQIAQDPWPLNAALDLALDPFLGRRGPLPDNDKPIE
jgi:hypothetical protein